MEACMFLCLTATLIATVADSGIVTVPVTSYTNGICPTGSLQVATAANCHKSEYCMNLVSLKCTRCSCSRQNDGYLKKCVECDCSEVPNITTQTSPESRYCSTTCTTTCKASHEEFQKIPDWISFFGKW